MSDPPQIAIIGAGLGGLCLAQGLRRAGLQVAVYERDASATARAQGYRISIDLRGTQALRACLPERLYQLFESTCGQPSTGVTTFRSDGQTFAEQRTMRFTEVIRPGVPAVGRAVDRLVLRETLLAGLDEVVHFGKEFTRYDTHPTGVQAYFADGTMARCDLLVAADGVSSRVRQQFLPHAALVDTGMRWLGGRTVLDRRLRNLLPGAISDRALSIAENGKQWFLAAVFFQQRPDDVARVLWPALRYTDTSDFLMWALIGRQTEYMFTDDQLFGASADELHRLAFQAVKGCHLSLREFVEAAAPDRSFSLAIRAMPGVSAWPGATPIAFVGDAIHASPVNGTGANAALDDAALLCRYLIGGLSDLQRAVDKYTVELLRRMGEMRAGFAEARSRMTSVL